MKPVEGGGEEVVRDDDERHLAWVRKVSPPTPQEIEAIPPDVRLARFVPHSECEFCALAYEDHTEGWTIPTLVCLKDWRARREP